MSIAGFKPFRDRRSFRLVCCYRGLLQVAEHDDGLAGEGLRGVPGEGAEGVRGLRVQVARR